MKWTQIQVHCKTDDLDEVCAIMSVVDSGLAIEDYSDVEENLMSVYGELIDEKILKSDRSAAAVSVYVPEERDADDALAFLKERFAACGIDVVIDRIGMDEEDWANQWKQYYKPLRIGAHLVVLPPWESYPFRSDDVPVVMDPGMAFGTGTHETTKLCLEMLEKHLRRGDRVLDVGTGSGILSIAAAKLGAQSVCAYDIDPVAVRVARENVEKNGVEAVVSCGQSDLLAGVDETKAPFDLVLANIVADILIRMAPDVGAYMRPGARLVASGVIVGRKDDVCDAMERAGLRLLETGEERDWNVLVFEK